MSVYDELPVQPACHSPLSPLRFLDRAIRYFGERTAVIAGDRRSTWAEIGVRCRRLASALAQRGVQRLDTVAVLSPNGREIFEAHFGVPMAGAVLNNINVRLEPSTLAYILQHSEAKVLLVDTEFAALARTALASLPRRPLVVDIVDPRTFGGERIGELDYEALLAEGDEEERAREPLSELQPISLNYTSGTTGQPKGVVYDHRNAFVEAMGNMLSWGICGEVTAVWAVPIFHANGWCYLWPFAGIGATNILLRRPTGMTVLESIREHRASHVLGAPVIAQIMSEVPAAERPAFTHPVRMLTAGAPPSPAHFVALEEMGIQLDQGYGLTEVWGPAIFRTPETGWASLPPFERARLKTRQGLPNMAVEDVIVASPDTCVPVPRDGATMGEVLFKGNIVMRGYLKDPAATAKAFAGDYFHSGDLAVWHPDGSMELKDRSKDIIISGGENISSIEIENVICEHPAVAGAAVIGVASRKWGEVPWAFVELRNDAQVDADTLLAHCRGRLAGFKVPSGVTFGPIPRTSTGKVQKFVLRQNLEGSR